MRKRRGQFDELFNLPMGAGLVVAPNAGETIEAALKRLKVWASKQKSRDRAYRMRIDENAIRVQRTPPGRNTPLSDWLLMKAGDRLLLKTNPTAADRKKAIGTADHLNAACRPSADGKTPGLPGQWSTGLDRRGRLIAFCATDRDGVHCDDDDDCGFDHPSYAGWNGEWP